MIYFIPEWVELVSLSFVIGTLSGRIWIFPLSAFPEDENPMRRAWRLFGIFSFVILATSAVGLLLRTSEMSGESFSTLWGMLPLVILRTHFGRVWLIRVSALFVLGFAFRIGKRHRSRPGFLSILLGLALAVTITESASGHASDAGDFSLPEIADWLHLLAASLWGGGLLVLSTSVLPALQKREWNRVTAQLTSDIAWRFSVLAGVAVAFIAITAFYNSIQYIGTFAALWKTPYGRTALIKLIAFIAVLGLGAVNRYASVPLLRSAAGLPCGTQVPFKNWARFWPGTSAGTGKPIARRFRRAVSYETSLFLLILLCAALLRSEIPSRHLARMEAQPDGVHRMHPGAMNPSR